VMASIDVKDAFPTVQQEVPTRVTCTADAAGSSVSYSLGRVLPGQRDGSLLWYKDLAPFVRNVLWKWWNSNPIQAFSRARMVIAFS
jgi:hypothetical protein